MKPRKIRVIKVTHPFNWWDCDEVLNKTFEVLDISEHNYVKIEYEEDRFGWLPLDVCEVNPHIKIAGGVQSENR